MSSKLVLVHGKPKGFSARVDHIPMSSNKLRHLHWAAKRREVLRWRALLLSEVGRKGPITVESTLSTDGHGKVKRHSTRSGPRARCLILMKRPREIQDWDNRIGCIKPVLDALTQNGWLVDDGPAWLDLVVGEEVGGPETSITVDYTECP